MLVACDDILLDKKIPVPHRIYFWDTADGSLAHQIEVPAGLPKTVKSRPTGDTSSSRSKTRAASSSAAGGSMAGSR